MAARASWKGYLKFSLVSCAVGLYPANTTSERISFNTLNRATGHRLRQQMIDEVTGEPVERDARAKGYEVSKGEYVLLEDEEVEALTAEGTHAIEIEAFVPADELDGIYLDGAHYLAPTDAVAQEAFAVIRDAMMQKNVVGIGRVVLSKRERTLAIAPYGKGMLASTLQPADEVRSDAAFFDEISDIKISDEMLGLATHIIDTKKGHFDPAALEDRYEAAVVELLRAKQEGRPLPQRHAEEPSNVINLMDALRRSVGGAEPDRAAAPPPRPAAASKSRKAAAPAAAKKAKNGAGPAGKAAKKTGRKPRAG